MKPLSRMVSAIEDKLRAWWDHEDQESPCLLLSGQVPNPVPVPDTDDLQRYWFDVDEGLARVMIEGEDEAWINEMADGIAEAIRREVMSAE